MHGAGAPTSRSPRALTFLAIAATLLSCTSSSDPMQASGIWVHWNADVRPLAGGQRFAAMVVGLTGVEIIDATRQPAVVERLVYEPGCDPNPSTIETVDVSGDGLEDIVVGDAACGTWVAQNLVDHFGPLARNRLPAHSGFYHLAALDVDGDGDRDIVTSTADRLSVIEQSAAGVWRPPVEIRFSEPLVTSLVWRPFYVIGPHDWNPSWHVEFQRGVFASDVAVEHTASALALGASGERSLTVGGSPAGFDSLDHVVETPTLRACGVDAMAVGRRSDGNDAIVFIRAGGTTLDLVRVENRGDRVVTAIPFSPAPQSLGIASIRMGADGRSTMDLMRVSGCADVVTLRSAAIEFDWRSALAPAAGLDPRLSRGLGVRLVVTAESDGVDLAHYDGFDLRRFHADPSDAWAIHETRESIHTAREDGVR